MSAKKSVPYGVKSLSECLARATLLAQPNDVPGFLATHVEETLLSRDEDSRDIKEVVFNYQEQWEENFLREMCKKRKQIRNRQESSAKNSTPATSNVPGKTSKSFPTPTNRVQRPKNIIKPSVPKKEEKVRPTAEKKIPPSTTSRPEPPKQVKKLEKSPKPPVRKTKPPPVIPPKLQKARSQVPKQSKGRKPAKKREDAHTCRLADCPYTNDQGGKSPARTGLEPDAATVTAESTTAKPNADPQKSFPPVPYRPKGGYIIDPELEPRRPRVPAVSNNARCNGSSLVSFQASTHTCNHSALSILMMRYCAVCVQCGELQAAHERQKDINLQCYF